MSMGIDSSRNKLIEATKLVHSTLELGNKGYDIFEKDKDNILVANILGILIEDIFRQLILQRIRIKDILRIFKDWEKDMDFWVICEVYAGSEIFRLF